MGILAGKSTLKIAVWASLMVHAAAFLGFELAFADKSKPFPKSEPRTVNILSIDTTTRPLPPLQNEAKEKSLTTPEEKTVSNEVVQGSKDSPEMRHQVAVNQESKSKNAGVNYANENLLSHNPGNSGGSPAGKENPLITEPVPVREIVPVYPFRARRKGYEGIVILDVVVSRQGVPVSCLIVDSSGFKDLDKAAEDTVLASSFYPGTVNGEEIESILRIHISFRLDKS